VIFDTVKKRFWHTSQAGLSIIKYQGKYIEDSSMFKLINDYSLSKCLKKILFNTCSDSLYLSFVNFSNKDNEIGGNFQIKDVNDSLLYKKNASSFNNIVLDKSYLEKGYLFSFHERKFWFKQRIQKEFNFYLFIFNDDFCSKQRIITDIDTFYFKKQFIEGELQISEGNRKLERCNCRKIAEQYKTY
jgi:hypothetical protein